MILQEKIKQSGLTDKESDIYLALLELGQASVSEISKKTGISRTFCYDILNKLAIYGLVDYISLEGKKRRYSAEHPRKLLNHLDNQKKKYERNHKSMEELLPDLVSLYKTDNKPVIKFYEGVDGIKQALNQTLGSKTEILSSTDVDEWSSPLFEKFIQQYFQERKNKKINEKVLVSPTTQSLEYMKNHPAKSYTEYRWLPKEKTPPFGCEVNIWEDKILMAVLKDPSMAVIIESKPLAGALKSIFELAWSAAEEYK